MTGGCKPPRKKRLPPFSPRDPPPHIVEVKYRPASEERAQRSIDVLAAFVNEILGK